MSKLCPNCEIELGDSEVKCPQCYLDLEAFDETTLANLEKAQAILEKRRVKKLESEPPPPPTPKKRSIFDSLKGGK